MPQAVLHCPRLHIRPLQDDDAGRLHRVWGDPDVIWWGHHETPAATAAFLRRVRSRTPPDGTGWWLLFDRASDSVVGDVVLQEVPRPSGEIEIGWHLARAHWGRGHATEAARRLMRHAAEDLGIDLLVADIAEGNERSAAVARRLGMTPRRGRIERGGRPHIVWEWRAG